VVLGSTNVDTILGFGQFWRSETLQVGGSFAPVKYTTVADMGGVLGAGPLVGASDASGNSNYNVPVTLTTAPDAFTYKAAQRSLSYTLNAPPVIASPADKSSVGSPLDFRWSAIAFTGTVKYQLQVAYDAAMKTPVSGYNPYDADSTLVPTQTFVAGTYYFKVRSKIAVGTLYTYGKWSNVMQFSVKLQSVGTLIDPALTNRIFPDNGATNVNVTTPFTWGTVAAASTYEIDIVTDPAFASLVASATGLTGTSYTSKDALKNATNYYWRVRAVNANGASDWVTSAFTTAAVTTAVPGGTGTVTAPVVTPIITVNVPTQPVQPAPSVIVTVQGGTGSSGSTPAWAWIVIAIGAVLVIAVIVLIVRTRKV